jgi:hypothetical protein
VICQFIAYSLECLEYLGLESGVIKSLVLQVILKLFVCSSLVHLYATCRPHALSFESVQGDAHIVFCLLCGESTMIWNMTKVRRQYLLKFEFTLWTCKSKCKIFVWPFHFV